MFLSRYEAATWVIWIIRVCVDCVFCVYCVGVVCRLCIYRVLANVGFTPPNNLLLSSTAALFNSECVEARFNIMFPSPFDLLDLIEAVTADFSAEGMEWYGHFLNGFYRI